MMTSAAPRSPLALLSGADMAPASAAPAVARATGAGAVFGDLLGGMMPGADTTAPALPGDGMPTLPERPVSALTVPSPLTEAVFAAARASGDRPALLTGDEPLAGEAPPDDEDSLADAVLPGTDAAGMLALVAPVVMPRLPATMQTTMSASGSGNTAGTGVLPAALAATTGLRTGTGTASAQSTAAATTTAASGAPATAAPTFFAATADSGDQAALSWQMTRTAPVASGGDAAASAPDILAPGTGGQGVVLAGGTRTATVITLPQHALTSPDWGDAFSSHLVTLAQQGSQSATLQLNPEELGPIQIRISVHDQAASIEFSTRHADTGDLIESAMPRLASALEAHGMRLEDARVSQMARHEGLSLPQQGFADARGGQPGAGGQSGSQPGGMATGQGGQGDTGARGRPGDSQPGVADAAGPVAGHSGDGQVDYYA